MDFFRSLCTFPPKANELEQWYPKFGESPTQSTKNTELGTQLGPFF